MQHLFTFFNWFLDSLPSTKYPWTMTLIERPWLIDNTRHYPMLNPATHFLLHFGYSVRITVHGNYCTPHITIHLISILHNSQCFLSNMQIWFSQGGFPWIEFIEPMFSLRFMFMCIPSWCLQPFFWSIFPTGLNPILVVFFGIEQAWSDFFYICFFHGLIKSLLLMYVCYPLTYVLIFLFPTFVDHSRSTFILQFLFTF